MLSKKPLFQPLSRDNAVIGLRSYCTFPLCLMLSGMILWPIAGRTQVDGFIHGPTQPELFVNALPGQAGTDIYRDYISTQNRDSQPHMLSDVYANANLLHVYPNPASGRFTVQLVDSGILDGWELYDRSGKLILKATHEIPVHTSDIDASSIPDGMYVLHVISGDQIFQKKITLQ